jgi:tRNA (cmo5U34)-methyltransferase
MNDLEHKIKKEKWTEQDSKAFIHYGDFFVPYRQLQADIICQLLEATPGLKSMADLCCGAGFLCKNMLEKFPDCKVHGYELSDEMLAEAEKNLKQFSARFTAHKFDLTDTAWRETMAPVDAFVSSLAIHHLNGKEKEQLYHDVYAKLSRGGVLLVADIIQPTTQAGFKVAASVWEQWVKNSAEEAGHPKAYQEFVNEKWNYFEHPDEDKIDQPSGLLDQLRWLEKAGFKQVDVFWMTAGHAIFGGWKML